MYKQRVMDYELLGHTRSTVNARLHKAALVLSRQLYRPPAAVVQKLRASRPLSTTTSQILLHETNPPHLILPDRQLMTRCL